MKRKDKVPFFFHGILQGRYKDEPAELIGYELFERGFNTIRRREGSGVSGRLAMVPASDIEELDMIEGFPQFYIRRVLPVVTKDGTIVRAWVYQQAVDWIEDMTNQMLEEAEKPIRQ